MVDRHLRLGVDIPDQPATGLSALAVAAVMLPKDRSAPSETLDVTGMLLLSPGMAALLGGMSSLPGRRTLADPMCCCHRLPA